MEKYSRILHRFFQETGAGARPERETVAAWRDSLVERGYSPATVNVMVAAVNDYQESVDNPQGKAKPLKRQRRVFSDAERELSRGEYFRLLEAARSSGDKRTLLLLQTICSTGIRVSELQYITVEAIQRRKASIQCKGKCREILLPWELCKRLKRWCERRRIHSGPVFRARAGETAEPGDGVESNEGSVQPGQRGVEESVSPQPAAPVCQNLLWNGKRTCPSWRISWGIPA